MPKTFREKVLLIVTKIPSGKTLSYSNVAKRAGKPKAYRAVGNVLRENYNPKIPCHRVILSSGMAGKYNRGENKKKALLKKEKIKICKKTLKSTN